jgi:hypothetical protein
VRTARSARLAQTRHAVGSTQSLAARPSASAVKEGDCRARTARGVLVSRHRNAPAAAHGATARRCLHPERLGRAAEGRRPHAACSSRAIATRRRQHRDRVRPSASVAREGDCGAWTARGVLALRDRDAPESAYSEAGPPPARLERAAAESGRHVACSSRAIATRRMKRSPCSTVRQRC